jgi:hypothetical protein
LLVGSRTLDSKKRSGTSQIAGRMTTEIAPQAGTLAMD